MIRLKNVSKFYYSKGVIASGFSKVNLELNLGEFVAITGESGSGKSTLLNVISGLDTYEEGEMYINGEETSHYTVKDFEDYRRKYIGNIFQNFNLVNSYTVYQNIELVLLLNGAKKKNIKNKVLELLKKVDLYKFKNTKVSHLSGGQKQRVAIARALAKDTPIIIADEPTGNLDSKASKEVIELLSKIAKEKLVVIVTHNYEQVEKYVTRKIKMHDGKILEDKIIKEVNGLKQKDNLTYQNITPLNKIRLALRNTFNIIPKFMLLLLVYLFITVAIIGEYAFFKENQYLASIAGYNYIFKDISDKRIIIKKQNGTFISNEDYQKLAATENIDYIVKNDLFLDSYISIADKDYYLWFDGTTNTIENFNGSLDHGRMPQNDNELIIIGNKNDFYLTEYIDDILSTSLYLQNYYTGEIDYDTELKVVGIKYSNEYSSFEYGFIFTEEILKNIQFQINENYSTINTIINNQKVDYSVKSNSNIKDGEALISYDLSYICPYQNCINKELIVNAKNIYYEDTLNLKISKTYNKWTFKELTGIKNYDANNGTIYISENDYNNLFNKNHYQSSIYIKDINLIDETIKILNNNGYKTLALKDTLVDDGTQEILQIVSTIVTIVLVIALFFISYFVISIILKSRNVYFSTIRMLGATKTISKQLLIMELLAICNLAFFSFVICLYLNSINVINYNLLDTVLTYLSIKDYLLLYIILISMSYLISQKFAKKLFKKSAISTIKEEV